MDRTVITGTLRHSNHRGFTLLEVMVALAVLAIALTTIYKLHGRTILMSSKARFLTVAPDLAQARLAEVERQAFKDIGDGSGAFGDEFPEYAWTLSIEDMPTELITDRSHHLVRINITITQNDENSFQLQTYRFFTDE